MNSSQTSYVALFERTFADGLHIERIEIPAVLLTCAPTPAPPPKPRTQGDVARYIVDLWEAGEDCRARVEAIRELQKPVSANP